MLSRRKLLSRMGAGSALPLLPGAALAQTDTPQAPPCRITRENGDWTIVSNANYFKKDQRTSGNWEVVARAENSTFVFQDYEIKPLSERGIKGRMTLRSGASGKVQAKIAFPKGWFIQQSQLPDDSFLIGREASAQLLIDGSSVGTIGNVRDFEHNANVPDWLLDHIKSGQVMTVVMRLGEQELSRMELGIAGFDQAWAEAPDLHQKHRASVQNAQDCQRAAGAPCVMTTASVEMLGRDDACFELTQMRRLRARFAHQTDVLAEYIATSQAILAGTRGTGFKLRLLAFYALVVWPTALLTRLGAMKPARALYLAGFALLRRSLRGSTGSA